MQKETSVNERLLVIYKLSLKKTIFFLFLLPFIDLCV